MCTVGVQFEGEKDKVIQHPENVTEVKNQTENVDEPQNKDEDVTTPTKTTNSVIFQFTPTPAVEEENEIDKIQQYGWGNCQQKHEGAYREMDEGFTAALAHCENGTDFDDKEEIFSSDLPLDFALVGCIVSDPKSIDEALHGPDTKHWQEALEYKRGLLEKLETWDIIDLPQGHTAIPCSKVMKVKRGPNGEILSYWVRIVAGGYRQIKGINYTKTFSAAAKMPTVRVILANAAHQDWEIEHIDIKSAYLNAKLKEIIYMKPPRGVLRKGQEGKVFVTPLNILRYNQACMFMVSRFKFKCQSSPKSLSEHWESMF